MRQLLAVAVAVLAVLCSGAAQGQESSPNVVFILVDDLRWDALGATGHPFSQTPNLDRLAREGAMFRNAFVTTPLCSPSRGTFLTGKYVHSHGIKDNSGKDTGHRLENFAKLLKPAGYENGYVGKWHMGNDASPRPGFDFWAGLQGQSVHVDPPVNVNGEMNRAKGYTSDILTSYAVSFIRQPREKPFTLFVGHKAVHGPFVPAPRHRDLYSTQPLPAPPNLKDTLEGKPALTRDLPEKKYEQIGSRNEALVRNQLRMLKAVDEGVGEVLKALEETKQLENTLVIFTSDNGYQWGEHRLGDKRSAYEESIRVPLLMRWPKVIPAGTKLDQLALNVDIAPTLLDAGGREIPADMQGRSLLPYLKDSSREGRGAALLEYFHEARYPRLPSWQSVRTSDGWKYIRYEFEGMDELYNLNDDPYEMKNLAGSPEAEARLGVLRAELQKLLKETNGELLAQRKWTPSADSAETSAAQGNKAGKKGAPKPRAGKAARKGKARQARPEGPPNVVLIFADDLGYGDIACFGNQRFKTPNLDMMAEQGIRLTQFTVPSPVCTPSRAGLLTGRHPLRVGLPSVLNPTHDYGLKESEVTLAEALKERGYVTAAIGKWHLGHLPQFLPTKHGFDEYFGIPYSNDMFAGTRNHPPLPLMRGTEVVEKPADQTTLTRRYTEEARSFIRRSKDKPFFLYMPHTFPHVPLHVSKEFEGKSGAGLYGDVVQEMDWSVGEILKELKAQRLDRKTLVIFTSDNGPWLAKKEDAGSAGELRDGKGTVYEGGVRVPFIARWPTNLPAGKTVEERGSSLDLFPTILKLAGGKLPAGRKLDGTDVSQVLTGEGKRKNVEMYYSRASELRAMTSGKWKVVAPVKGNKRETSAPLQLFDLEADFRERRNLAAEQPEVAEKLLKQLKKAEKEMKGESGLK